MSNKKAFVVVQIISGERVLKKWFGGNVNQDTPLVDLFAEFASAVVRPFRRLMVTEETYILDRVFARANLVCNTPIELPYYTVGHMDICLYCGNDHSLTVKDGCYPICAECTRTKKSPKARRCGKSVNTQ